MRAHLSTSALVLSLVTAMSGCNSTSGHLGPPDPTPQLIVAPNTATIESGTKLQLFLSAHDENGQTTTPFSVAWTTSDPVVASVAADGTVTGLAVGDTKITASWNGVYSAATIKVTEGPRPCQAPPSKDPAIEAKTACIDK
jgi:hypothetical protein